MSIQFKKGSEQELDINNDIIQSAEIVDTDWIRYAGGTDEDVDMQGIDLILKVKGHELYFQHVAQVTQITNLDQHAGLDELNKEELYEFLSKELELSPRKVAYVLEKADQIHYFCDNYYYNKMVGKLR